MFIKKTLYSRKYIGFFKKFLKTHNRVISKYMTFFIFKTILIKFYFIKNTILLQILLILIIANLKWALMG